MVIISQASYPPEVAQQMASRFLEAPEIPDFMVRRGPYVSAKGSEGVFILSLFELDNNANLAAGLQFLGNYHAIFFGIPGFKYEFKPFFNVEEALKTIGM